jgi:hypothetical protein
MHEWSVQTLFICGLFNNSQQLGQYSVEWLMNNKGYGRKRSWPAFWYKFSTCLERLWETTKISITTSSFRAKIWTRDLSNTKRKYGKSATAVGDIINVLRKACDTHVNLRQIEGRTDGPWGGEGGRAWDLGGNVMIGGRIGSEYGRPACHRMARSFWTFTVTAVKTSVWLLYWHCCICSETPSVRVLCPRDDRHAKVSECSHRGPSQCVYVTWLISNLRVHSQNATFWKFHL